MTITEGDVTFRSFIKNKELIKNKKRTTEKENKGIKNKRKRRGDKIRKKKEVEIKEIRRKYFRIKEKKV